MEKKLSLQDYENFYKSALLSRQKVHQNVPKTLNRLSKFQQICRVCGCSDDGTFVDLDKYQEFEFEPTISSYRQLFQRASLQFQFSTMPDMPGRICGICSYKAKIFFLLTRQFVIGQQIMRTAVTDYYRDNYAIEPPEQLEDLLQLRKQLENVSKIKQKSTKAAKLTSVYGQVKSNVTRRKAKPNRSSSSDHRFDVKPKDSSDSTNHRANKVPKGRKNTISNQTSPPSRVNNVRQPNRAPNPVKNVNSKSGLVAQRAPPYVRKERTGAKASSSNKEVVECHVSPRLIKKCTNFAELLPVKSVMHHKIQINPADGSPHKSNIPPSKAQLQKKLLERRKQWR
ncbi:hypothetical protein AWZ03_003645 [Drosophila navojoa]|uniref:ZAD domain-containing protein n=1 Tax=Drosophila navojoa TaxID=7232 RepID=A0A484BM13_DRONA|nr:uncharacterized protein LOC115562022 [Drosophila navojoa]TDG49869.1 hypothetical protein AWZ03_003645 [Drosophila navojoa]